MSDVVVVAATEAPSWFQVHLAQNDYRRDVWSFFFFESNKTVTTVIYADVFLNQERP